MPISRRLILDLNRCFEPNAFNTGPSIAALLSAHKSGNYPEIVATKPNPFTPAHLFTECRVPDLTNSPASSVSTLLSQSLEDDEIKKIFADSPLQNYAQLDPDLYSMPEDEWSSTMCFPSKIDEPELNPKAAPFIPFFAPPSRLHNPVVMQMLSDLPEPDMPLLPLGFEVLPFDLKNFPPINTPPPQSQGQIPPPLYPPGLPHPRINALQLSTIPEAEDEAEDEGPLPAPPPAYLPDLLKALKPTTTPDERVNLVHAIVGCPVIEWEIESLLQLTDRLCFAIFGPSCDCEDERITPGCEPARYSDYGVAALFQSDRAEATQSPEEVLALVVEELYKQFFEKGEPLAKSFVWHLRELMLMRFIHSWDPSNPTAISFENQPPSHYVRSSLSLCKGIATLFKRNFIMREHVIMCISLLLRDLMSVEHTEALAHIVLGCGVSFWNPPYPTPTEPSQSTDPFMLAHMENQAKYELSVHIQHFLAGLESNLITRSLNDHKSVLGQSWGAGQLNARIQEILDSVKLWQATLLEATPAL